jgi:UDP-N-acetylglucosamine acyltransferase
MPIHPTAIIHPSAELAPDVEVQAYSIIESEVQIGAGTVIGPHNVIGAGTVMGSMNRTYSGAQVGVAPQDLKHHRDKVGQTILGDHNIIREFVTISSSTVYGDSPEERDKATRIGSHCLFMATCHVGHDCVLGDHVIIANGSPLAGHVTIHDRAFIGGLTGIHQFCVIGTMAFIGGMARVNKDVPPYMLCEGHPARCFGPNVIGLERNGMSAAQIKTIRTLFKLLYRSNYNTSQALEHIAAEVPDCDEKRTVVDFVQGSQRGLIK